MAETIEGATRVLVVDDDPAVLESMRAILGTIGTVVTVETAERALIKLEHQEFDVIVADYGLPAMNGMDLLHMLSERNHPVSGLLITGSDDYYSKGKRGGHRVMLKPVDPERLCSTVRQLAAIRAMKRTVDATRKTIDKKSVPK